MNQPTTTIEGATPEVLAWLESLTERGVARPSLFKSLLDAGGQPEVAPPGSCSSRHGKRPNLVCRVPRLQQPLRMV